jgi:hypothetical protein
MRQTARPWEAIGLSHATWWRGKPGQKTIAMRHADVAHLDRVSVRTAQRIWRVIKADPVLAAAVGRGAAKWG